MGWASDTPVGTGSWYGLYTVGIYNLTPKWDLMGRVEWFNDTKGTRNRVRHQLRRSDVRRELAPDEVSWRSVQKSAATLPGSECLVVTVAACETTASSRAGSAR